MRYFKCIKSENNDYNCPEGQYLNFYAQKCRTCPSDSNLISEMPYCEFSLEQNFDYRNEKCVYCPKDSGVCYYTQYRKCPIETYGDGGYFYFCKNGNWDESKEKCLDENGKEIDFSEPTSGNFIKEFSLLLLIIYFNLF